MCYFRKPKMYYLSLLQLYILFGYLLKLLLLLFLLLILFYFLLEEILTKSNIQQEDCKSYSKPTAATVLVPNNTQTHKIVVCSCDSGRYFVSCIVPLHRKLRRYKGKCTVQIRINLV